MKDLQGWKGLLFLIVGIWALSGHGLAQTTQHRDRGMVSLKKKRKPITCTVLMFSDQGLSYSVKGKKAKTVPLTKIRDFATVNDFLTEFFERFDKAKRKDVKEQWALVAWANDNNLEDMAKLQAYRCLHIDPQFVRAHKFLGHRRKNGVYKWKREGGLVSEKEFKHPKRGRDGMPWFESPHFRVRSSRDILGTIGNLYDLERVWLDWHKRYHDILGVSEHLERLGFEFDFIPARSTTDRPYFDPSHENWFAYTKFDDGSASRPKQLFSLLTQQLMNSLYAPLGGYKRHPKRSRLGGPNDRNAMWLELGFGWWFGGHYTGEVGYAKRGKAPQITAGEAKSILKEMRTDRRWKTRTFGGTKFLPNLLGWSFDTFYSETKRVEFQWLVSRAFVAFLMTDGKVPGGSNTNRNTDLSDGTLGYIAEAYRSAKGNSSSLFDKKLGYKIEKLERPFVIWLEVLANP